jgi:hypothetical protein
MTVTRVNTEFAQCKLFICRKEKKLVHAHELDAHFGKQVPLGQLGRIILYPSLARNLR